MNRKLLLALALASALGTASLGVKAQSDEGKEEKKPEQSQLIVQEDDKKETTKPELVADEDKKETTKPELIADGGDSYPKGSTPGRIG